MLGIVFDVMVDLSIPAQLPLIPSVSTHARTMLGNDANYFVNIMMGRIVGYLDSGFIEIDANAIDGDQCIQFSLYCFGIDFIEISKL
ncbi:hypothetical protein N9P24_00710 [bacterium]|nr:hypothetical protein [bacterium]